ncbi:MAG: glycosyltransferase, partial [Deltaproteobacteria bacterium]|nr:glycosyltransferase [Deltaproteobacteria bacterium]
MSKTQTATDLAFFLATSGHSGVDRVMSNLIHACGRRGLQMDLLRIAGHGPYFHEKPEQVRFIELGCRHVNGSFAALRRYLREVRPPVLLSDKDRLNRLALLGRRLSGSPTRIAVRIGTTVSDNLARRGFLEQRLQYFSMRHLYPQADAIIVPSQGAADDLARIIGPGRCKITVVPSPVVDPRLETLRRQTPEEQWFDLQLPKPGPLLLGVGELSERKDFATLIKAFARLHKLRPQARLLILGEGRERRALTRLIAGLGLEDAVRMPGFDPNPYA